MCVRGHCKQVLRLNQGCSSRDSGMKITVDLYYCSQDGGKNKNARFKPSAAFFF